LGKSNK